MVVERLNLLSGSEVELPPIFNQEEDDEHEKSISALSVEEIVAYFTVEEWKSTLREIKQVASPFFQTFLFRPLDRSLGKLKSELLITDLERISDVYLYFLESIFQHWANPPKKETQAFQILVNDLYYTFLKSSNPSIVHFKPLRGNTISCVSIEESRALIPGCQFRSIAIPSRYEKGGVIPWVAFLITELNHKTENLFISSSSPSWLKTDILSILYYGPIAALAIGLFFQTDRCRGLAAIGVLKQREYVAVWPEAREWGDKIEGILNLNGVSESAIQPMLTEKIDKLTAIIIKTWGFPIWKEEDMQIALRGEGEKPRHLLANAVLESFEKPLSEPIIQSRLVDALANLHQQNSGWYNAHK